MRPFQPCYNEPLSVCGFHAESSIAVSSEDVYPGQVSTPDVMQTASITKTDAATAFAVRLEPANVSRMCFCTGKCRSNPHLFFLQQKQAATRQIQAIFVGKLLPRATEILPVHSFHALRQEDRDSAVACYELNEGALSKFLIWRGQSERSVRDKQMLSLPEFLKNNNYTRTTRSSTHWHCMPHSCTLPHCWDGQVAPAADFSFEGR